MSYAALLLPTLLVAAVCVVLAVQLVACRRSRAVMAEQLKVAIVSDRPAVRQLRLASHNLRAIGMTLQGHAESLKAGGPPDIARIANIATGVFDIADYMQEWIQHAPSANVLDEVALNFGGELDEAISTVSQHMLPGRRTWRIEPDVIALRLRADRRALRHILTRALSVAVRSSGHDDSIQLRLERAGDTLALVIEQQPRPAGRSSPTLNGGGPDLRLSLARELMEAHGGKLDIEPREDQSVRVRIAFPIGRLVKASDEICEPPTADIARGQISEQLQHALAN